MWRRDFMGMVGTIAVLRPLAGHAEQSGKTPRVGVLWHASNAEEEGSNYSSLVSGFSDAGYVVGRSIILEHRFANERPEDFQRLAAELVASNVDVIVTIGANGPPYAKAATTRIPVVFALVPDPLGSHLVTSLARPEANVTGFSDSAGDLIGKRIELCKEILPGLSRVALLVNANSTMAAGYSASARAAAQNLGLDGPSFTWRAPEELDAVFGAMKSGGVQFVMINPDGWAFTYRDIISRLAIANALPLSCWSRQTLVAGAGALMSYGVDHDAICRRVAVYVDKLLKGAKPSELPVEQPAKFEFLINLRTARALGLNIPASMLSRADEVLE